jgi:hypothetical protein
MAEVEYGGVKVSGGKLLLVLPLIGTLGGGLWAGFEFYKDYMDMKEQIQNYMAPDLSGINTKLEVLHEEMMGTKEILATYGDKLDFMQTDIVDMHDQFRDTKMDVRDDIIRTEGILETVEDDIDEVEMELRDTLTEAENIASGNKAYVREFIDDTDKRYDDKISGLEGFVRRELENLEDRLNDKLTKALDNPLANR